MNHDTRTNSKQFTITKFSADFALIEPLGICLTIFVLGLAVSISLSIYLLKAIAAERAKIIHKITKANNFQFKLPFVWDIPKKKPISANGIAKIVWLNLIKER